MGEADIAEEVARSFGYARLERRTPAWPQPGRLTTYQRDRRRVRDVLCGLGASEAWTNTFLSESEQLDSGFDPPYVEVTNPLVEAERYLRSSMAPGLLRAVRYNVERRQDEVRFFEVGSVFRRVPGVDASAGLPAVGVVRADLRGLRLAEGRCVGRGGWLANPGRGLASRRLGVVEHDACRARGEDPPRSPFRGRGQPGRRRGKRAPHAPRGPR